MKHVINSRVLNRKLTFYSDGGYIFVDLNGKPGVLGFQICKHGELSGETISCNGNFAPACKAWYKAYTRHLNEWGMI